MSATQAATSTISVASDRPGPGLTTARPRPGDAPARFPWAGVPLAISLGVNAVFLVGWWVPEFSRFPGRDQILTQLAPLASDLVSQGQAVVVAQQGRSTLVATVVLLAAIALPFCARSRRFGVRVVVSMAVCYLGAIGWVVTLLGLLVRGSAGAAWLGLVLFAVWVVAAALTAWRAVRARPDELPERSRAGLVVVVVVAALNPVPLAIGRAVFAPELTAAARTLAVGDPTVRLAALTSAASVAAYAAGVAVVLVAWSWFELAPPLRPVRVPWRRRREPREPREPLVSRLFLAGVALVLLAAFGGAASQLGAARAQQITDGGPGAVLPSVCAAWTEPADGPPTSSLVARGAGCATLVGYTGWQRGPAGELRGALSPVQVSAPGGPEITARVVAGRYGGLVVLATTGRLDRGVDQLSAVRIADGAVRWTFRCDDDQAMSLRFAGSDDRPDAAAGHTTERGEPASIVVACQYQRAVLNPRTGQPLRG